MTSPRKGARSIGRECALMVLFGSETSNEPAALAASAFFRELAAEAETIPDEEARHFTSELCVGVEENLERIDQALSAASDHWRLERMSRVDRNLLRLATYELLSGIPKAIVIDEAVELAKRFGTSDSGPFVNGLLSRVAHDIETQG